MEKKRKRKTTTTTKTKKKKLQKPSSTPQQSTPNPIPSLPDDLVLNIIARISRLYYPTLLLVSKSFRSLLASPELYKTRSLLGRTESCFYLCLTSDYSKGGPSWFTLCRKTDEIITNDATGENKKKSSGYGLAKVPISQSPDTNFSSLVAVGSNIYNIGVPQSIYKASSSTVSVLDCTSHTWRQAPCFPVEIYVVDRKIYVTGWYTDGDNLKNTFQVFDTRTQVWDPEPISCFLAEENGMDFSQSACIDGKFHIVAGTNVAAYNAKEGRWDLLVKSGMYRYMYTVTHCDIENVLYSFSHGAFRWYDSEVREWRILNGLVGLPKFRPGSWVGLADYGGKMMVLWAEICGYDGIYRKMIWCAEIALERPKSCEIWGKLEWYDHVLTVSADCEFQKVLAATV